ncbi:MAG: efflux RND transporter periplasmic adaptor subunit, partial [Nitratireductor sp.]
VQNAENEEEKTLFRIKTKSNATGEYPFSYVLQLPIKNRNGKDLAAISFLKEMPFQEREIVLAKRLIETGSHAWSALKPRRFSVSNFFSKPISITLGLVALMILFIPVSLRVLAPVEIVPHKPLIVAAPLAGVVEEIKVEPNTQVSKGDELFSFNKIELLSKFEVANRNAAVMLAKYKNATQGAFGSADSKRDLAITKAEYEVAIAERDYAKSQLSQTDVKAEKEGVILFSSVEKWLGKPVVTGERIMQIANPNQTRMRIEVEAADSIILKTGAQVSAFLDSNSLDPVSAVLETQAYQAEKSERDVLVFPLRAKQEDNQDIALRIGLRGTAQIKGEEVPLWFYLFRKPISALRQMVGF